MCAGARQQRRRGAVPGIRAPELRRAHAERAARAGEPLRAWQASTSTRTQLALPLLAPLVGVLSAASDDIGRTRVYTITRSGFPPAAIGRGGVSSGVPRAGGVAPAPAGGGVERPSAIACV